MGVDRVCVFIGVRGCECVRVRLAGRDSCPVGALL